MTTADLVWRAKDRELVWLSLSLISACTLAMDDGVNFWALQAEKSATLLESGKGEESMIFYTSKNSNRRILFCSFYCQEHRS